MIDALQQNPVISIIVILAAAIPIIWRTLHALYVKPRDFRIAVLEKHMDELRGEMLKKPVDSASQPSRKEAPIVTTASVSQPTVTPSAPPDPLRSLEEMHKAWKREGQTELQQKHFEETYTGQEVCWEVFIDSIDKSKYWIAVYADARLGDVHNNYRVCAHFPLEAQNRLLEFRPRERVRLSGPIKEFFLFPKLEPAKIEKA